MVNSAISVATYSFWIGILIVCKDKNLKITTKGALSPSINLALLKYICL